MKNKTLTIVLAIIFSLVNLDSAKAISFSKEIKKLSKKSVSEGSIKTNLGGFEEKIIKKLDDKIDSVVSKVEDDINKYKAKIDKETARINDIISEAESYADQARNLKAKASKYLMIAKIIIGALSCGILGLLFFVWRVWRNVVAMKKAVVAAVNYNEIKKRIDTLEEKVAALNKPLKN